MWIRRIPRFAADDGGGGATTTASTEGAQTEEAAGDDGAEGGGEEQKPLTMDVVERMIQSATDKLKEQHKRDLSKRDKVINDLTKENMSAEEKLAAQQQEVARREQAVAQAEVKLEATKALASEGLSVEWADRITINDAEEIPAVVKMIKDAMSADVSKQVEERLKAAGITPRSTEETKPSGATTRVNPWKRESWNLTEQMRITRSDPKLAAQLRQAAG